MPFLCACHFSVFRSSKNLVILSMYIFLMRANSLQVKVEIKVENERRQNSINVVTSPLRLFLISCHFLYIYASQPAINIQKMCWDSHFVSSSVGYVFFFSTTTITAETLQDVFTHTLRAVEVKCECERNFFKSKFDAFPLILCSSCRRQQQ